MSEQEGPAAVPEAPLHEVATADFDAVARPLRPAELARAELARAALVEAARKDGIRRPAVGPDQPRTRPPVTRSARAGGLTAVQSAPGAVTSGIPGRSTTGGTEPEATNANVDVVLDKLANRGFAVDDLDSAMQKGITPLEPSILRRTDGVALLYAARVNTIFGEASSGKSWLALLAAKEVINGGRRVLLLDYEDRVDAIILRLLALGLSEAEIADGLLRVAPTRPLTRGVVSGLRLLIAHKNVGLVIVDSAGEAMALDGVKPNSDEEVATWMRSRAHRLAATGACVLLVDHVPRDAKGDPIGSVRKINSVDGAAWIVAARVAPAKGRTGYIKLTCRKDKNGCFQRNTIGAQVVVESTADGTNASIVVSPHESGPPTTLMARVVEFLAGRDPCSKNQIESAVQGKAIGIRAALTCLVEAGTVVEQTQSGNRSPRFMLASSVGRKEEGRAEGDNVSRSPLLP